MAATTDHDEGKGRAWRKPSEPMPWGKVFWQDWLSNPAKRRLTDEQRARYMDIWASTWGSDTPGVMEEDAARAWARYSPEEWKHVREAFARLFNLTRRRGMWVLMDVLEQNEAAMRAAKTRHRVSMAGVEKRREGKGLGTGSSPEVQLTVGPPVAPAVQPAVDKTLDAADLPSRQKQTGKTDSDSRAAGAHTSRSRSGTAGTAGSSRPSRLEPIVAAALGSNPNPPLKGGSA